MIRLMTAADVPAAMALKQAAGWNQTEQDWRLLLSLAPESCWVYECDGAVAASTSIVAYDEGLAWLGMVLVAPPYRRRGFARALVEHALTYADSLGVGCVKLDATELGRPLYLQLGFGDEQPIERWEGRVPEGRPAEAAASRELSSEAIERDGRAFGADRRQLLRALAEAWPSNFVVGSSGFACLRPGSNAQFLGPCVTESPAEAEALVRSALAKAAGERVFWDLLPRNAPASELAARLGFQPARRLVRMARPLEKAPPDEVRLVWAAGGFEYG